MLMKKSYSNQILKALFFVFGFLVIISYQSKADTSIKENKGIQLKTTNLVSNKVIKVPPKEENIDSETLSNMSKDGSVYKSRGGSSKGVELVSYGYKFLGRPYVFGASGPKAFDCSGFTAYVYSAFGMSLPHYTGSQYEMGKSVSRDNLKAGDLVFFNTYGPISHVGIYIGGGEFIHAASGSKNVTVSDLGESYYAKRYAGARRILN